MALTMNQRSSIFKEARSSSNSIQAFLLENDMNQYRAVQIRFSHGRYKAPTVFTSLLVRFRSYLFSNGAYLRKTFGSVADVEKKLKKRKDIVSIFFKFDEDGAGGLDMVCDPSNDATWILA